MSTSSPATAVTQTGLIESTTRYPGAPVTSVWPIDMDTLSEDDLEEIALSDPDRSRRRKAINLLRMREFRDGLRKMGEIMAAVHV